MLICKNCDIEYEDGKKFCKHCGDPLAPKEEPFTPKKKMKKIEGEDSEGKLICPVCKITYEFGSSCIQCGSALLHQIPSVKEEPEISEETELAEEGSQGDSLEKAASQAKEEPKALVNSEFGGKPSTAQTLQEQPTAVVRKRLVCLSCGIIYERGDSCVRCGSSLVPETSSEDKPASSEAETIPSSSPPNVSHKIPKIDLEPDLALPKSEPPLPLPKEQDFAVSQPGKRKKIATSLEELFQDDLLEQPSAKKPADTSDKKVAKKPKRDYRRLCLEVGGMAVMAMAGGYFLWSVFFQFTTKPPELKPLPSKETAIQMLPVSTPASNPAATSTEPGGTKSGEENQKPSKQAAPSAPAGSSGPSGLTAPAPSEESKTLSAEASEIRSIKALLEHVRQANLQKDIDLFSSCYASDFLNLDARKRATLAYWEKYNYLDLSYSLKNPTVTDETAKARVEWLIKSSPKSGGQPQENRSVLHVTFKKEYGGWRIKEVKVAR